MLFCVQAIPDFLKHARLESEYMNEYDWYGLDNAAKIFPAISGNHTSSVYRLDVRLKNIINPVILEEAVNTVLPSFPAFMVRMRKGLFWYYFEHNFEKALVTEESSCPCNRIDAEANAGYLFKFSYYNNKINLDVYHVLTDGTGAMNFLQEVVLSYLKLSGEPIEDSACVCKNRFNFPAMENSFAKFRSTSLNGKPKKIKAFHLKGTPRAKGNIKVIHGVFETDAFIRLVKSKNVSVTSYIAAVLAFSFCMTDSGRSSSLPLRLNVPINLRHYFESETQRNFFTFITVDIDLRNKTYTFEEVLQLVAEQMAQRIKPEYFLPQINYFIEAERNIFARVTPLFIKNLTLRLIYHQSGDETFTCTLSNLGKLGSIPSIGDYIERFECIVGVSKKNHLSCGICSFKNQLVVTFTKSDFETDVEKNFFRFLSGQGLEIILEQN
jgi:NRPS condensation-like uncharacterized protein